ncbi:COG1835 Predicted acyltransferases [Candidatus Nanopelagicaceae bacterium]
MHYLLFPVARTPKFRNIFRFLIIANLATIGFVYTRPLYVSFPGFFLNVLDAWVRLGLYSTLGFFLVGFLAYLQIRHKRDQPGAFTETLFEYFNLSHKSLLLYAITFLFLPCPFGSQIEAIGFILFSYFLSICILNGQRLSRCFQIIGKYSYFIYFAHHLVLEMLQQLIGKGFLISNSALTQPIAFLVIFIIAIGLSLLLGVPSYKYFEYPIIRMSHKNHPSS